MSDRTDQSNLNRRAFLGKSALATATAVVAPGVFLTVAKAMDRGASSEHRWGMLIDTTKCSKDCDHCVTACDQENGIDLLAKPEGHSAQMWAQQRPRWIRKITLKDRSTERETHLPMMCQHCEFPPCVDVCPTGASFKRADGIVMVDRHLCIGCRYCMMACPYKARSFIHNDIAQQLAHAPRGKGCVEACNLCVHRIDQDQADTACREACTNSGGGAIVFGDLNDPDSEISMALSSYDSYQIRDDLELNTGVRYTSI